MDRFAAEPLVAPFAGAWIEIEMGGTERDDCSSLPSRERGLKSARNGRQDAGDHVAPFAGAWIEIAAEAMAALGYVSRSLRGSVD